MAHAALPSDFAQMSVEEQVLYVQDLWDVIAQHVETMEVPATVLDEAERRWAAHCADPSSSIPEDEVFRRLLG